MTTDNRRGKKAEAPAKSNAADVSERLVPTSIIRGAFKRDSIMRADLIFEEKEGGYRLRVRGRDEWLVVARREGDVARTWRSVERALMFIKDQFGFIEEIILLHPLENEQ